MYIVSYGIISILGVLTLLGLHQDVRTSSNSNMKLLYSVVCINIILVCIPTINCVH